VTHWLSRRQTHTQRIPKKLRWTWKNSLLKNGSVPRRCWLSSFAFSLENCYVVQQTRGYARISLLYVAEPVGEEMARKTRKRKEYIYMCEENSIPFFVLFLLTDSRPKDRTVKQHIMWMQELDNHNKKKTKEKKGGIDAWAEEMEKETTNKTRRFFFKFNLTFRKIRIEDL
jgi:hypothetical protein